MSARVEQIGNATLYLGDCLDILPTLDPVDAVVTDPPYHLTASDKAPGGFMGRRWDGGGVAFKPETWGAVRRLLQPGGHCAAFSGARTYHRLAAAIETAGFEIRDQIMWLYGSGFPKSLDIAKAIDKAAGVEREVVAEGKPIKRMILGADQNAGGSWLKDSGRDYVPTKTRPATDAARQWAGWGTALKPAHEPICLARAPLEGTNVDNVQRHGTGALNIDGCRVETNEDIKKIRRNVALGSSGTGVYGEAGEPGVYEQNPRGRWPANVVHDGSAEVEGFFPEVPGQRAPVTGAEPSAKGDAGSAARFFYTAKATADERAGWCRACARVIEATEREWHKAQGHEIAFHPTVKPLDLMRWLARLVVPKGALVLDPFMGTGSTGIAALAEGCRFIGIEQDLTYFEIACHRLREAAAQGDLFADPATAEVRP